MIVLDEQTYINFVTFDQENMMIVQFKIVEADVLEILVHTQKDSWLFEEYINWVIWIFADSNQY